MFGIPTGYLIIYIERTNTMAMKKKGYARGGMKKKSMARGGMPMKKDPKTGKMVPAFAMDGKGKMAKGGMMKKKKGGMAKKGYAKGGMGKKGAAKGGAMALKDIRAAAKLKGYKLVKIA